LKDFYMPQLSPFSYHEVIEASNQPGCPVCRWTNISVERQLKGLIFDSVNDVDTRLGIRKSLGFCHEHAWQLPEAGDSAPLGIAFIYRDILNTVNKSLAKVSHSPSKSARLKSKIMGSSNDQDVFKNKSIAQNMVAGAPCPACVRKKEMGDLAITAVVDTLAERDERMIAALTQSDGLCFSHLRQSLDTAPNQFTFDTLVQIHQEKLTVLIAEMDEFIRKNDYRFQHEGFGDESDSWRRGMTAMVGQKREFKNR
jgi:hypothetical protein